MPHAGPPLTQPNPIGNLLGRGCSTKPDDLALVSAKTRMSWSELGRDSPRVWRHSILRSA